MRTDVHAPSSVGFDPAAYTYQGAFDLQEPLHNAARRAIVSRLVDEGYSFGSSSSACGHCGHAIRYGALLSRADVMEIIYVGETCLDNRFSGVTAAEFQQLRKNASLNAARSRMAEQVEAFIEANPALTRMADYTDADSRLFNPILDEMWGKLQRYGSLSDKQVAFAIRLMGESDERAARREQVAAEKAELLAAGVVAPEGKVTVCGEVVALKLQESQYGDTWKMVVKDDAGWAAWVTVPSALTEVVMGDRVVFTATLTRSESDPLFAFAKRPTKAHYEDGRPVYTAPTFSGEDFEL